MGGGIFKTSLEKYDYGPSVRAEVNTPLITTEATQRQAIVQKAPYYLLVSVVHENPTD